MSGRLFAETGAVGRKPPSPAYDEYLFSFWKAPCQQDTHSLCKSIFHRRIITENTQFFAFNQSLHGKSAWHSVPVPLILK